MSAAGTPHGKFHRCECYGHDKKLPNYAKDISVPRTLQGYYAPHGGCPCQRGGAHKSSGAGGTCFCAGKQSAVKPATPAAASTYRAPSGPHVVHASSELHGDGAVSLYSNAKNYGGTVAQRGPTTLASTARPRNATAARTRRTEEQNQSRKNFLKAVLRDEMLACMDATAERDALEEELGLMGSKHAMTYTAAGGSASTAAGGGRRGLSDVPSVAEQHEEVMDELRYVADQPVGSKLNITRLYYLVEEQERINALRAQQMMQQRSQGEV